MNPTSDQFLIGRWVPKKEATVNCSVYWNGSEAQFSDR